MAVSRDPRTIAADNVKALRLDRGISVVDAAEFVGVDRTYWYLLESGRVNFTIDKLEKVAELFRVTVPDLLTEQPRRGKRELARR